MASRETFNEKKREKALIKLKRRPRCYCITSVDADLLQPWTAAEPSPRYGHCRIEPGRLEDVARNWRKQYTNRPADVKKATRVIQQRVYPWQLTVAGRKVKYVFSHLPHLDNYMVSYRESCTSGYHGAQESREQDRTVDDVMSLATPDYEPSITEPSLHSTAYSKDRFKCYSDNLSITTSRQSVQLLHPPEPSVPDKPCWSKGFWSSSISTATAVIKGCGLQDDNEEVTIKTQRPTRSGKPVTLVKYRESLPCVTEQPSFCISSDIKPSTSKSEAAPTSRASGATREVSTPTSRASGAATREVSRQTICKPIFRSENEKADYQPAVTSKGRLLTARCRSLSDAGLVSELNNSLTEALTGRSLITDTPTDTPTLKLFTGGSHSEILHNPPSPPMTLYEAILQDPIARPVPFHRHEIKHSTLHSALLTKPLTSIGHRKYRCQSAHRKCINKSLNRRIPSSKWIFVDSNGSFTLDKKVKVSNASDDSYNIEL